MDIVVDTALRLLGAFYVLGCAAGLRRGALDRLLTNAIGAIARPDPREQRAELIRNRWIMGALLLVGLGGVGLLALLDVAAWLFTGSLIFYLVYLFVVAPRLDRFDPPDDGQRAQRWNALVLYLLATALVLAAWWYGRLQPVLEAHMVVQAGAALLAIFLAAYAVRLSRQSRLDTMTRGGVSDDDLEAEREQAERSLAERVARLKATRVTMRPSLMRGVFFDDAGDRVDMPLHEDFTSEDDNDVADWLMMIPDLIDPTDPYRCRLLDPDDLGKLDAVGRPIYERLLARMGADRIRYEPTPMPIKALYEAKVIKLMADYPVEPLWILDDDRCDPMMPEDFGLSIQLARDISAWEHAHEAARQSELEGTGAPWDEAEQDAHEERGRVLAVRIARELEMTGRGDVTVYNHTRAVGVVPVRAGDPVPS